MFPDSPFAVPTSSFNSPVPVPTGHPNEGVLVSVCFNEKWLPYVIGSLKQLWLQTTWSVADQAGLDAVQQDAALLTEIFGEATMCCLCPQTRVTEDGRLQYSYDGEHWFDYPGGMENPNFNNPKPYPDGTVPPGQDAKCLSAENIISSYKEITQKNIDLLEVATGFIALAAAIGGLFAAILSAGTAAAAAVALAATVLGLATAIQEHGLDDDLIEMIRCSLYCHADSEGFFTADAFQGVLDDIDASGFLVKGYVHGVMGGFGPVGLNRLAAAHINATADCSDCDCGWCDLFNASHGLCDDLLSSPYPLTPFAAAVCSGTQWNSADNSPYSDGWLYVYMNVPEGSTAKSLVWVGSATLQIQFTAGLDFTGTYIGAEDAGVTEWSGSLPGPATIMISSQQAGEYLTSLQVSGIGDNPFPSDNC